MCKLAVSAKVLASFKTRKAFLWPLRLDSFGCEPDISDTYDLRDIYATALVPEREGCMWVWA